MSIPNFLTQSPIPSLVDNKVFQTSQTYDVIDVSDPTGKRVLHQVSSISSLSEVTQVVTSSSLAFQKWRWSSISTRRSIFEKGQSILKSRLEEYAALTMEETTMSKNMAGLDLKMGLEQMNEASNVLAQALKSEMAPVEDETNERQMIVREPFGVVLGMAPFNFPFNLAMRAVLCAILAGNTTILKTSEYSPRTHLYVAQILYEAGLPPGVLNVIHVSTSDAPEVVENIIQQPAIRKINFTGSTRVGRIINKVAAEYLKPCVLELGGKAPMIVMKNADLDLASNQILFSSLANQGQVCMSGATILAHKSISEDLKKRIQKIVVENKDKFEAKREGTSDSSKHHIRSLFCSASGEKAKKIYEDAISKGAEVFAGTPSFDGALIQPVYLSNVTREMDIFKEEVFGPVVGMVEFETTEEAIELANFNETALSSAIFCKDESEAFKLARRIESGAVHINGSTIHDNPFVPHGGIKSSGFGRFNGVWGLHEFTNLKVISISGGTFVPYEVM